MDILTANCFGKVQSVFLVGWKPALVQKAQMVKVQIKVGDFLVCLFCFYCNSGFVVVVVEGPIWMEDKCNHFKRESVSQNLQEDLLLFELE